MTATQENQKAPAKKGGAADTFKGILILLLLLIGAGAGGYFFGTYQKFAPIESVAPGTPGAVEQASSATSVGLPGANGLKKKYWLQTEGHEHIGYSITTYVNGQLVAKVFTPGKQIDITKFVKPGENSVRFEAKTLPASMNEHRGDSYYHLNLAIESGKYLEDEKPDTLINYKRTAAEDQDFDDTMTFVTME